MKKKLRLSKDQAPSPKAEVAVSSISSKPMFAKLAKNPDADLRVNGHANVMKINGHHSEDEQIVDDGRFENGFSENDYDESESDNDETDLISETDDVQPDSFSEHVDSEDLQLTPEQRKLKKRQNAANLYRAPTADEMSSLKQTSELFKSNLFRLQIDELLKETRVDFEKTGPLEKFLHKLKSFLDNLDDIEPLKIFEAVELLRRDGVEIPFANECPKDAAYTFAFEKPNNVAVVGSYLLKTCSKSRITSNIDVAVDMPAV
ncbi:hypothetical protein HK096_009208, partial [Nowakowskiella sp. JEL0078]